MDDIIFAHISSIPLQRMTSLRRRAQINAPAASYSLSRVLGDGGRRGWTSSSCKDAGGVACTTALLIRVFTSSHKDVISS